MVDGTMLIVCIPIELYLAWRSGFWEELHKSG